MRQQKLWQDCISCQLFHNLLCHPSHPYHHHVYLYATKIVENRYMSNIQVFCILLTNLKFKPKLLTSKTNDKDKENFLFNFTFKLIVSIYREGLQAKRRVTRLVLVVIIVFVGIPKEFNLGVRLFLVQQTIVWWRLCRSLCSKSRCNQCY